ncbi:MAG: acetolactate synthase small subunit [Legionellaceae bacterium]|nr:acetolactate synthase small subunit [Legionellaceae bacterium]MBP9775480.1 acetolactate synthase small subunit [Legionellaceae bacterium]
MRHIISILIENESGALSRVAGVFSARGYNIESLTVAATEDPSLSRMTLVTRGSEEIIAQITKHLNKLIDVVKLIDLAEAFQIERELMMIKIKAIGEMRDEIRRVVDTFGSKIIDVTPATYIIEMTGPSEKIDTFIATLDPTNIIEMVRSGPIDISMGEKGILSQKGRSLP